MTPIAHATIESMAVSLRLYWMRNAYGMGAVHDGSQHASYWKWRIKPNGFCMSSKLHWLLRTQVEPKKSNAHALD